VHPLKDIVQALLQGNVCDMMARLVMVVEFGIKRLLVRLQAISYHKPRLLVADFLGLLESLPGILDFSSLGHDANEMEPDSLIHDVPEPSPLAANLDFHLIRMPDVPNSGSWMAT